MSADRPQASADGERGDRRRLAGADLDEGRPVLSQVPGEARQQGAVGGETVGAAVQRPARLEPRHLGLEKVIVRLNVLDRTQPEAAAHPIEVVIEDPTGTKLELSWREVHDAPLEPARDYERKVVEARRRRLIYPYEIIRLLIVQHR